MCIVTLVFKKGFFQGEGLVRYNKNCERPAHDTGL